MHDRKYLPRRPAACISLLIALSSAPLAAQDGEDAADEEAVREPQVCLDHPTIRRTRVLDNRNIVFITRDHTIYNNQLPRECPSLRRNSLVSYPIEQRRLCAGGSFTVLWQTGATNTVYTPAFVCHLGYFVPISESELEDLTLATEAKREPRPRRRSPREAITTERIELPPAEPAPAPPAAE